MFSWICPRCGHDNPPSAVNCFACGARFDEEPVSEVVNQGKQEQVREEIASRPVSDDPAVAPRGISGTPRELPPRPPMPFAQKRATSGMPTWLLTILSCFAILGVGSAIYYGVNAFRNRKQATSTGLDSAANVARTKLSNPLQKYVEVVGIRMVQDAKKKPEVRFVVVNHSSNELDDLSATVTLWASTNRSEEDSVGTFTFKIPALPAYGAKDLSSALNTKLKIYELPDWQNATPEVQITSP